MWTRTTLLSIALMSSVALAADPLPPGPYIDDCQTCSATAVGETGLLLGCLCEDGSGALQVVSTYLQGTGCPTGVVYQGGALTCAAFDVRASTVATPAAPKVPEYVPVIDTPKVYVPPVRVAKTPKAAPAPTQVAAATPKATPSASPASVAATPAPASVASAPTAAPTPVAPSAEVSRTAVASNGSLPSNGQTRAAPATATSTRDYWNIRAHADAVSYPKSCWLARDGGLICTCPAKPRPSDPIYLAVNDDGWDCACGDDGVACTER